MESFKTGDMVRLKFSGPPRMRVVYPYVPGWKPSYILWVIPVGDLPPLGARGVGCEFWDDSGVHHVKEFKPNLLQLVDTEMSL